VDTFLLNAQRIFDVARADSSGENSEFALLIRPDGGVQMFMEGAEALCPWGVLYNVKRCSDGVRVAGQDGPRRCELEENTRRQFVYELLRDQPLYSVSAPLLT
jgi:hypothetical protein